MKATRYTSSDANVLKYVFDFGNAVAEAVLYKYPTYGERTVMCVSTQSGCPVGCRFCGAGDNFVRSLSEQEIVSQVAFMAADQGIDMSAVKRGQIMFMSMGEPMLNFRHLDPAIRTLHEIYPRWALLISTSAPAVDYAQLTDLSVDIPMVGLQFSVHESTDEARNALIPFKAKLTLADIAREGQVWHDIVGRQPFFNYCAHEGNVSSDDALRLYKLFSPDVWQATISVVCERDETVAKANERQRDLATGFMAKLNSYGFSTRCFNPAGQDDIGGGCGQLFHVQNWMREHPEHAMRSVGHGLPVVHMPTPRLPVLKAELV